MVGVPLDPLGLVQPGQNLLQESIGVALAGVYAKLSEPDRLVEGVVELGEVVLEVLDVVPSVVVGNDEVDLAVATLSHELLEVVDALVGLLGVGNGRRTNLEALRSQGLDVCLVGRDSLVDGNAGASSTVELLDACACRMDQMQDLPDLVWLVDAQDVLDVVLGASIGDILRPTLGAPLLVGVKKRNIFETAEGFAVDDSFPVIHPANLVCA